MKKITNILLMAALGAVMTGCYNNFDKHAPEPSKVYTDADFTDSQHYTVQEVKDLFLNKYSIENTGNNSGWGDTKYVLIEDDIYIKGKVISSDEQGNVYKSMYVQDETGAIEVKLGVGVYINYPMGTVVYVKLKGLYLGNYRMMLSLGGQPTFSYNANGLDRYYANSNIEDPASIAQFVFRGEYEGITEDDILDVPGEAKPEAINGIGGIKYLGRLIRFKGITCHYGDYIGDTYGEADYYPSYFRTDDYTANKWYTWAYSDGNGDGEHWYGSVAFTFDTSINDTRKPGVYLLRTSGYSRFARRNILRDGATGDLLVLYMVYGKRFGNDDTYQVMVSNYENIEFAEGDFLSDEEVAALMENAGDN